ncbi:Ionotropic receptor 135, partial [Blattella germanica]
DMYRLSREQKLLSSQGLATASVRHMDRVECSRNKALIVAEAGPHLVQALNTVPNSQFTWLVLQNDIQVAKEMLQDTSISFDCELLVATPANSKVDLTEVYRVSDNSPLQTDKFGVWNSAEGLKAPQKSLQGRRTSLHGLALKTGLKIEVPVSGDKTDERESSTGFFLEYWENMEKWMNFTTEYLYPSDGAYGGKLENGSWSGVIGMLMSKEVDASSVAFEMTADRAQVVDFTLPLYNIRSVMIIRMPSTVALTWNAFLNPFSHKLWGIVIFAMILCILCIATTKEFGFSTSSFLVAGIFCLQGHSLSQRTTSLRLLLLTAYVTAVVIMASYSASFISSLTLRKPKLPFKNFREFLQDGSYQLSMLPSTSRLNFFKSSQAEIIKQVYRKTISPSEKSLPTEELEGMERLCTHDNLAYIVSDKHLAYFGHMMSCGYKVVPGAFVPGSVAIALRKGSPYKGLFNYMIRKLRRGGHVRIIYERFASKRKKSLKGYVHYDINLPDVAPILFVLLWGVLQASCFLLIERCVYWLACKRYLYTFNPSSVD